MADVTPGSGTSEFKFAAAVAVLGAILAGLSVSLGQLQQILPEQQWISVAGVIVGGLMTLISSLGFSKSRTVVKVAASQAAALKTPEAPAAPANPS